MWRVYKESGRPWPVLCPEDDVLDYMVMEAVFLRVQKEDQKALDKQRRDEWKQTEMKRLSEQYG